METTTDTDTSKQTTANRQNARRSTGPRTDKGKAVSARNATRHGLLARVPVLPDEDADAFGTFAARLVAHLAPVGELEELLVDRVVLTAWRLQRVGRIEADILAAHYFDALEKQAEDKVARYVKSDVWTAAELAAVMSAGAITDKVRHAAAVVELEGVRAAKDAADNPALGRAFMRDHEDDAFTKLSRYEAALERSLYRALHELQRLQAVRAGNPVPPPVAVDVTLAHEA